MTTIFSSLADSDAFEQLCFDILVAEGFKDVRWRGPGADGGRDIEAGWSTADPAGGMLDTRWYIECKWYTDSVPFSEIESKLLAAWTAKADYLLVATSSRIRNTAMNSIEEWLATHGSPFRVRYWTGRDVLRLVVKHRSVFQRHFPGVPAPTWGEESATIHRLESLLGSTGERLTWRAVPVVQKLLADVPGLKDFPARESVVGELELLLSALRAHDLFTQAAPEPPSTSLLDVQDVLLTTIAAVERRHPQRFVQTSTSSPARSSRPLLQTALFELLLNAAQYAEGSAPMASLASTDTHWHFRVTNAATTALPAAWPQLGFRGSASVAVHHGQGFGCWLAEQASTLIGARLHWTASSTEWTAELEGPLEKS